MNENPVNPSTDNSTDNSAGSLSNPSVAVSIPTRQPEEPTVQNNQAEAKPDQKPHKSGSILGKLLLVMTAIIFTALASGAVYALQDKKIKDIEAKNVSLQSQITELNSTDYELPAGTIPVSDCIPGMGIHNMIKGGDKEYGPFILTTKKGKVIGTEFMASADMFKTIPGTNPPVSVITKASPMFGWKYDHAEFSQLLEGHPGLERNHIDVHLFTVDEKTVMDACN